ncbi:MAG: class I SAM-dependent RNA methyltransferase, partial [Acidimicrobiales bacterium]|nr:class I SAM-dependent RNA methyltransferase [Acidimicrobiales bacterium]
RHLDPAVQPEAKAQIVREVLERLGGLSDVEVVAGLPGPSDGYRTTVRCAVANGRAGYRRRQAHDIVAAAECPVVHPLLRDLIVDGRYGDATEVVLRCSVSTGERLAAVWPTASGVSVPDDVRVVGGDELDAGRRVWLHETVAGRRFRVSAQSFFQSGVAAAELLVDAVGRAVATAPAGPVADLYAGVGLFSATVLADRQVVAVERNRAAVADARVNLGGMDARIVRSAVERWRPSAGLVAVVADPARTGLGRDGVAAILQVSPELVALVSCDPGSLARDAGLLCAAGYGLGTVEVVDCFPRTSHVETVSTFVAPLRQPMP